MNPRALGPAALLAATWAGALWGGPFADARITDVYVYRFDAHLLALGARPYSDAFPFEYPPLALVPMWLARALGGDGGFEVAFGVLMGLAALATLLAVARLGGTKAAWCFALVPLAAGAVLRTHFDLLPAALVMAGLALVLARRSTWGLTVLGAGTVVKLFPALAAAIALAWLWGRGERPAARRGAVAFSAVVLAFSIPFAGSGYLGSYRFHLDRPVQLESTPASVLLLGGGDVRVTGTATHADRFRSNGVVGGGAGVVEGVFAALAVATLVLLGWLAVRSGAPDQLLVCAAGAVLAFVALGKVLSPQYMAWLAPFAAVLWARGARTPAALIALAIVLTQVEFPRRYAGLVEGETGVQILVALRNAVLLAALVALIARAAAAARWPAPEAARARSAPAPP